jgi:hypothetical protein
MKKVVYQSTLKRWLVLNRLKLQCKGPQAVLVDGLWHLLECVGVEDLKCFTAVFTAGCDWSFVTGRILGALEHAGQAILTMTIGPASINFPPPTRQGQSGSIVEDIGQHNTADTTTIYVWSVQMVKVPQQG